MKTVYDALHVGCIFLFRAQIKKYCKRYTALLVKVDRLGAIIIVSHVLLYSRYSARSDWFLSNLDFRECLRALRITVNDLRKRRTGCAHARRCRS